MGLRTELLALKKDEENGTDNGEEVQRQVHEVADQSFRCELGERL